MCLLHNACSPYRTHTRRAEGGHVCTPVHRKPYSPHTAWRLVARHASANNTCIIQTCHHNLHPTPPRQPNRPIANKRQTHHTHAPAFRTWQTCGAGKHSWDTCELAQASKRSSAMPSGPILRPPECGGICRESSGSSYTMVASLL